LFGVLGPAGRRKRRTQWGAGEVRNIGGIKLKYAGERSGAAKLFKKWS